jgi:RNA polymerase sigma factor (sigma-70 family)
MRRRLFAESDGEILRLALKQDDDAWTELVRRFTPVIEGLARKVGLSSADAADVAQATWLQLSRKGHAIREPDRIAGWLACTARRESIRLSASNQRRPSAADPLPERVPAGPIRSGVEDSIVDQELAPELLRALATLPKVQQRLVLLLIRDEQLTYVEIARRLQMSTGSIGPTRQRALGALRRELGSWARLTGS